MVTFGFRLFTKLFQNAVSQADSRSWVTSSSSILFFQGQAVIFMTVRLSEPLVVVASPDHDLSRRSAIKIHDLQGQTILLPKHDCSYKMIFEQILAEEKVHSVVFMQLNSIEAMKACVLKGIGVAMIPLMTVKEEVAQEKLTILPWPEPQLETAVLMIHHKDKWLSPPLKEFMGMVKEIIQ